MNFISRLVDNNTNVPKSTRLEADVTRTMSDPGLTPQETSGLRSALAQRQSHLFGTRQIASKIHQQAAGAHFGNPGMTQTRT